MISRKTIVSLALIFVLVFSSVGASFAAESASVSPEGEKAAEQLYMYGLLKGSANGFNLEGATTKAEASVMVVRMMGKEADALAGYYANPYQDVQGWASAYIACLYGNGIIADTKDMLFEPDSNVDTVTFLTMMLSVLGYIGAKEVHTADEIYAAAISSGLLTAAQADSMKTAAFTRETMVLICNNALNTQVSGQLYTLFGMLNGLGVIQNLPAPTDEIKYGKSAEQLAAEAAAEAAVQKQQQITSNAKQYMGIRYRSGGRSPSTGFDCSGFVGYVMIESGVWSQFYGSCDGVMSKCTKVTEAQALPGDIVFFKKTYNSSHTYTHVGIYLGNNQMIHSASSKGISISSFSSGYWAGHYACIARPTAMM